MFFKKKKKMSYIDFYKSLPSYVFYQNDEEYRKCIRTLFQFDPKKYHSYDGLISSTNHLDKTTKDELQFDENAVTNAMDQIFLATKSSSIFNDLYTKAAARMFSTNPETGQAVLCSYDTLKWYHTCVWYFLNDGHSSVTSCKEYSLLKNHLA